MPRRKRDAPRRNAIPSSCIQANAPQHRRNGSHIQNGVSLQSRSRTLSSNLVWTLEQERSPEFVAGIETNKGFFLCVNESRQREKLIGWFRRGGSGWSSPSIQRCCRLRFELWLNHACVAVIVLGWRMLALLLCRVRWRIELDAKPYSCASAWPFFCRRTVEPRMRVSSGMLLLKLLSISPLQSFCFFFVFFFNLLLDRETNEGFFCYVLRGWDFCRFGWRFKVAPLWFLEVAVDSWSSCGFLEEVV